MDTNGGWQQPTLLPHIKNHFYFVEMHQCNRLLCRELNVWRWTRRSISFYDQGSLLHDRYKTCTTHTTHTHFVQIVHLQKRENTRNITWKTYIPLINEVFQNTIAVRYGTGFCFRTFRCRQTVVIEWSTNHQTTMIRVTNVEHEKQFNTKQLFGPSI